MASMMLDSPPASKSITKPKYQPGVLSYGCEHIRIAMKATNTTFEKNYKNAITSICNNSPINTRNFTMEKGKKSRIVVRLTSLYMCLQCDAIIPKEQMEHHSVLTAHRYCMFVHSRTGDMFCNMCKDFVFDPTLESHRINKVEMGTFSNPNKRKPDQHVDLFQETDFKEATRQTCNTTSIRGMWNMGSTCYMSVILESMVFNPLMRNFYLGEGHKSATCPKSTNGESCLSCHIDDMFQKFNNTEETSAFSAHQILASFMSSTKPAYAGLVPNEQQDAHEFLNYLREELHELNNAEPQLLPGDGEVKSVKRIKYDQDECKCVIHQTFYGKTISTMKCKKCGDTRKGIAQSFADLNLGLDSITTKKPQSLQTLLKKEYFTEEILEVDCQACHSKKAIKKVSIKTLPNVLCIQLKRFVQRESGAVKIKKRVTFPLKLEMLPYTDRADEGKGFGHIQHALKNRSTYHLQSVVSHKGDAIEQGHYVSYSKHDGQWFLFDDHKVYLASKPEVLGVEAYILFYVIQSVSSVDEQK